MAAHTMTAASQQRLPPRISIKGRKEMPTAHGKIIATIGIIS